MLLFTDGSVHPPSKTGYGACLIAETAGVPAAGRQHEVLVKRFENTSSTRLEIETLLWALSLIKPCRITIYSDSQNLIGLPGRRTRLEQQHFCSADGQPLHNAALYREFFRITDRFDCTFIKIKGHRRSREKSGLDQLFTLVDRAARQALRAARA